MSNVLRTNENLDAVKGRNGAEMPEIPLTFIIKKLSLLMGIKGALKRSLIKKETTPIRNGLLIYWVCKF